MASISMHGLVLTNETHMQDPLPSSVPHYSSIAGILHTERRPSDPQDDLPKISGATRKKRRQRQVRVSSAPGSPTEEGQATEPQQPPSTRLLRSGNESVNGVGTWATPVPLLGTVLATMPDTANNESVNNVTATVCVSIREDDTAMLQAQLLPSPAPERRQVGVSRLSAHRAMGSMAEDKDAPFHLHDECTGMAAEGAQGMAICNVLSEDESPATGKVRRERGKRWVDLCHNASRHNLDESLASAAVSGRDPVASNPFGADRRRRQKDSFRWESKQLTPPAQETRNASQSNLLELMPSVSISELNSAAMQEEDRKMANYYMRIMNQKNDNDAQNPTILFPLSAAPGTAPADGEPRKTMKLALFAGGTSGPNSSGDLSSDAVDSGHRHYRAKDMGGVQSIPAPVILSEADQDQQEEQQRWESRMAAQKLTCQSGKTNVFMTRDASAFSIADSGTSETSAW